MHLPEEGISGSLILDFKQEIIPRFLFHYLLLQMISSLLLQLSLMTRVTMCIVLSLLLMKSSKHFEGIEGPRDYVRNVLTNGSMGMPHKCAPTAQLHAMQELWDSFMVEEPNVDATEPETGDLAIMILSQEAISGKEKSRAMKFHGKIQGIEILLLIDSGSSHTFISEQLTQHLQGVQPLSFGMEVKVADGGLLKCSNHLPQGQWSIQQCCFVSDIRILSLPYCDMIVGMDWLEAFSPMKIDWVNKWISLPYHNKCILLQGILTDFPEGIVIQVCLMSV